MWKIFSSLLKKSENASPFSLSVRKCTSREKNFFYVEQVNRDRCRRYFKEVKGNRAIHSVPSGTTSCRIQTRQVSWYCENCIDEEYEASKNSDYVSAWQMVQLESEIQQQARVTRSEAVGNLSSIKDLLTKEAVVAIASGDYGEDYYLLKITGNGQKDELKMIRACNLQEALK